MRTPFLLLLGGCLSGPGNYFEYPAGNEQWHPKGIGEALSDKGASLNVVVGDTQTEWNFFDPSDGYTELTATQEQQTSYDPVKSNLWQAYGVRLLSVTMDEREIRIIRHCEEDHNHDDDDIMSDSPHDFTESDVCEDNMGAIEYEYETLGSMSFNYELEDQECEVSITRAAPLDYSEASTWRFREYPDDPEWSDVNTCEDLMSDEDTVGALDEIVFGKQNKIPKETKFRMNPLNQEEK